MDKAGRNTKLFLLGVASGVLGGLACGIAITLLFFSIKPDTDSKSHPAKPDKNQELFQAASMVTAKAQYALFDFKRNPDAPDAQEKLEKAITFLGTTKYLWEELIKKHHPALSGLELEPDNIDELIEDLKNQRKNPYSE